MLLPMAILHMQICHLAYRYLRARVDTAKDGLLCPKRLMMILNVMMLLPPVV